MSLKCDMATLSYQCGLRRGGDLRNCSSAVSHSSCTRSWYSGYCFLQIWVTQPSLKKKFSFLR